MQRVVEVVQLHRIEALKDWARCGPRTFPQSPPTTMRDCAVEVPLAQWYTTPSSVEATGGCTRQQQITVTAISGIQAGACLQVLGAQQMLPISAKWGG